MFVTHRIECVFRTRQQGPEVTLHERADAAIAEINGGQRTGEAQPTRYGESGEAEGRRHIAESDNDLVARCKRREVQLGEQPGPFATASPRAAIEGCQSTNRRAAHERRRFFPRPGSGEIAPARASPAGRLRRDDRALFEMRQRTGPARLSRPPRRARKLRYCRRR